MPRATIKRRTQRKPNPKNRKSRTNRDVKEGGSWFSTSTTNAVSPLDSQIDKYQGQIKQLQEKINQLKEKIASLEKAKEASASIDSERAKLAKLESDKREAEKKGIPPTWSNLFGLWK